MLINRYIEKQKKQIQREKNKELAQNVAIGVAMGAIAGLLLAPKSGEDTRKDIKTKSIEISNDIKNNIETKKDNLDSWKKTFSQIKSDIKDRVNEGKAPNENDIVQESVVVIDSID